MSAACDICALQQASSPAAALVAQRTERWVVRHHAPPAPLVGWTFLSTVRHVQGAADLDDAEAAELGPMLRTVSRAVRTITGCDRVYAIAFGQGAPHLHVHLVPRFDHEAGTRAWAIADWYRAVERGERPAAAAEEVAQFVERLKRELRQ